MKWIMRDGIAQCLGFSERFAKQIEQCIVDGRVLNTSRSQQKVYNFSPTNR